MESPKLDGLVQKTYAPCEGAPKYSRGPRLSAAFPRTTSITVCGEGDGPLLLTRRAGAGTPSQKGTHKKRCQEPYSWPSGGFLGRPRGRSVVSRPNRRPACSLHDAPPNGQPRCTLRRIACNSSSVCGALTCSIQPGLRGNGHAESNSLSSAGDRKRGHSTFSTSLGGREIQRRLQAEALCGDFDPAVCAEWRPARDAAPDRRQFGFALNAIHRRTPIPWQSHRRRRQPGTIGVGRPQAKARPTPIFRALDESRPQRIPLDITQHGEEVLVALDGKGFEPSLPDVPAAAVVAMVAANVTREQPLHPASEVAIGLRPKHEMKMVRHQAPADQPHRQPLARRANSRTKASKSSSL